MSDLSGPVLAILILLAIMFAIVLIFCWIVLPFAVIGMKPLLRDLIEQTKYTNHLLERLGKSGPPARP